MLIFQWHFDGAPSQSHGNSAGLPEANEAPLKPMGPLKSMGPGVISPLSAALLEGQVLGLEASSPQKMPVLGSRTALFFE